MILLTSACKSDYGRLWELLPIKKSVILPSKQDGEMGGSRQLQIANKRDPNGNIMGVVGVVYIYRFLVLKFDFYEI